MLRKITRWVVALMTVTAVLRPSGPPTASAADTPPAHTTTAAGIAVARGNCPNPPVATAPRLPHGALAMYCVPPNWNGDLVIWAHGYVDFTQPLGFYHLTYADGNGGEVYLPDVVESLGFAFATTSYRANGLVILHGVQDVEELIDAFPRATGQPRPQHTYQTGASEGGIVSTLLAERSPQRISGALAACGPIGNFQWQINYVGDLRAIFDYFFTRVLPGSPTLIPSAVISGWDSTYKPAVQAAIRANPDAARQLYRVVGATVNPDPAGLATSATDVLWYNVFGTNDAVRKLGGNPYDNSNRFYLGADDVLRLNAVVERAHADPKALANLAAYDTTGRVSVPLVTLHTTGDDIIPWWHELLYFFKVEAAGTGHVTQIPVDAYGHCNFSLNDILGAFALLVLQVASQPVPGVTPSDPSRAAAEFQRQAQTQRVPDLRVR
jgi:alpha-beta hydrolase superfamily lysophospholipase